MGKSKTLSLPEWMMEFHKFVLTFVCVGSPIE